MPRIGAILCGLLHVLTILSSAAASSQRVECYDVQGRAQRCIPPFVNAAFNRPVTATNTCGQGPNVDGTSVWPFCVQTHRAGTTRSCDWCDGTDPHKSHPVKFLTDFHNANDETWWQSETMLEGTQWPSMVNLTLNLGKAFDITYVRLKFHSSRPESFAIYKRTRRDSPWVPYQFYSASCRETYNRELREIITRADETKAICTDEFSDISPLQGGSVAFSTLEGRPSAYDFENSAVLQEWVSAEDVRIVLNRMNTFGDEVFKDPIVLQSYFYAIHDFAVGGRCKCNGHASECSFSTGQGLEEKLVCICQHNTQGDNCDECQPFYNDRPWGLATAVNAHDCQPCNCNGLSRRCFFDEDLYQRTGHGGHCLDCEDNTAGAHCDRCKDNYFRRSPTDRCQACNCNPVGSETEQCESSGRCRCKPGVTGDKCDRCSPNFFEFGPQGCRACKCTVEGSRDNRPECLPDSGTCQCKEFVEGQNCDRCRPGFFGLDGEDPQGCMACFCYGHTSDCIAATGYSFKTIHSEFNSGRQRWTGQSSGGEELELQYNSVIQNIGISSDSVQPNYFVAPERYQGDHRYAFNRYISFSYRAGEDHGSISREDVVIEGGGLKISIPLYSQGNPSPRSVDQEYRFKLNEHQSYGWMPQLSSMQFIKLLSNITTIKIRGTYNPQGVGFLDNVHLDSATRGHGQDAATNVEQCQCPQGYVGQFCESCAPGYRREPANGGAYAMCVPCNCNGHSDTCDVNSGHCICQHNTVGDNCHQCAPGYYGYALAGTPDDCTQCPCPNRGECVELINGDVACINCREGYTGNRCDMCSDGYFGDPTGRYGPRSPCQKCTCNDNIDYNAVANCNATTGQCLKCIFSTGGFSCERCLAGHYGSALNPPPNKCEDCACYPPGTLQSSHEGDSITCEQETGNCRCQVRVTGRQCKTCRDGYWNIDSGRGCEACNCNSIGAKNQSCNIHTGQCHCKPGVTGLHCDECEEYSWGFSVDGCQSCQCDPEGSRTMQCNPRTGQCLCLDSVEGLQCDRCVENKYNKTAGCIDCPLCYNLVQEQVNILRHQINQLREIIVNIGDNPQNINDTNFRHQMSSVNQSVVNLWNDAKNAGGGIDSSLGEQLHNLEQAINLLMSECNNITNKITESERANFNGKIDITEAEKSILAAEIALRNAEVLIETDGKTAIKAAREAQEKTGQQSDRMTEIARLAREEATRQEEEAAIIKETATNALNTSREAYRIAQEAMKKPDDVAREIDQLRRDVGDAESLYNQTKSMAERAKAQSVSSYDEALKIYQEVEGLILPPDVNIDQITQNANQIKDDAAQIKERATQLIEDNKKVIEEVEKQKILAEYMLSNGTRQQQITDELLADAHKAEGMAEEAIKNAEKTVKDAYDMLQTLKEFDQKVQESKALAEEAKKQIPDIEDQIRLAQEQTRKAQNKLKDALVNAEMALSIANEAKTQAETASQKAGSIRAMAQMTKERARQLANEAEQHKRDTDAASSQLEILRKRAEEDERLAKEALQKADQAKTSAQESSAKVHDALGEVESILRQLQNLDSINVQKLTELENSLDDAELRITEARIEERYQSLVSSQEQQLHWVQRYTYDLKELQDAVANIEVINATIPRTCFKQIVLEPTDPSG